MLYSLSRTLFSSQNACVRVSSRLVNNSTPIIKGKYGTDQICYLKAILSDNKELEWTIVKNNTLKIPGSVNLKNIDGVLLKVMVNTKKFDTALSFAEYLKSTNNELNLGSINGLLYLYHEMGKENELSSEQKFFILQCYEDLYEKYKVLDATTCERLLHALCTIKEWKKALKVLEDINFSSKPSHSAYSTLIATFFDINKKAEAYKLIERSVNDNRPLQTSAYEAWISYILRKYKDNKTKIKYLEDICTHIFNNSATIKEDTAHKIQEVFISLGWNANVSRIRKIDGECTSCHETLDCLKLTEDDFIMLQKNIKDKLIVGSDLFLKTSPQELDKFLNFVKDTAPYDIVLDALNIAYVARRGTIDKVTMLNSVVTYFSNRNKKILLLGRKYMLTWPKRQMADLLGKTCSFFIDDLSQDDPYFIAAAILSGSHTDIVSKDLLRGHRFKLKDDELGLAFKRWQWEHQWMVFINKRKKLVIQPPLKFTPCAQKKSGTWHIPFEKDEETSIAQINDGTPDLTSWLCLRPTPVT